MLSLSIIPGIGPKTLAKLEHLGITTPSDLLYHFPHRYIDFSHITLINNLEINSTATITGKLLKFSNIFTRSHKNIQIATVADSSGSINLIWFNQPYLSKNFVVGDIYSFAGTVSLYQNKPTIIGAVSGQHNTGKIIAIYPETKGLSSSWFRKTIPQNINNLLANVTDFLPPQENILNLATALKEIHEPSNEKTLEQATIRLGLDEILSLQCQSLLNKQSWASKTPHQRFLDDPKIESLIKSLPFKLTDAQVKAWQEIRADLLSNHPSNRLLQGDVGSGKTIVAILACYLAHLNKSTSLLVAPTEILAQQHLATFKKFLKVPIKFLSGNKKIVKFPNGSIIIATHAAIYKKELFKDKIGLLIVDEQHKFGVAQRTFLIDSLTPPHYLTMTATPIPRTIGLTIMGNLELSTITAPPLNRLPIKTYLVPPIKQIDCYQWLAKHIKNTKEQAFIVCPFIEPSETLTSVKSATELFTHLQKDIFPDFKLGLIHGKIPPIDRDKILKKYQENKINILITTPIIEVGIDFPNATTIIIQSADRFGLAGLHQLRGRVGRSDLQSYCYLFSESSNDKAINRLKMLVSTNDGQKIAEYDLKTRGPGDAFSLVQHGFPSLKIASLSDYKLISLGQQVIKNIQKTDPHFDFKKLIHHHSSITATN